MKHNKRIVLSHVGSVNGDGKEQHSPRNECVDDPQYDSPRTNSVLKKCNVILGNLPSPRSHLKMNSDMTQVNTNIKGDKCVYEKRRGLRNLLSAYSKDNHVLISKEQKKKDKGVSNEDVNKCLLIRSAV